MHFHRWIYIILFVYSHQTPQLGHEANLSKWTALLIWSCFRLHHMIRQMSGERQILASKKPMLKNILICVCVCVCVYTYKLDGSWGANKMFCSNYLTSIVYERFWSSLRLLSLIIAGLLQETFTFEVRASDYGLFPSFTPRIDRSVINWPPMLWHRVLKVQWRLLTLCK